jgi:hypothetical protein
MRNPIENDSLFNDIVDKALASEEDSFSASEREELEEIGRRLDKQLFLSVRQIDFLEQVRCRLLNKGEDK